MTDAIDDRQDRARQVPGREVRNHLGPTRCALVADQPHVADDTVAIAAHAQRHKDTHALPSAADANFGILAVHEDVANVLIAEIALVRSPSV